MAFNDLPCMLLPVSSIKEGQRMVGNSEDNCHN